MKRAGAVAWDFPERKKEPVASWGEKKMVPPRFCNREKIRRTLRGGKTENAWKPARRFFGAGGARTNWVVNIEKKPLCFQALHPEEKRKCRKKRRKNETPVISFWSLNPPENWRSGGGRVSRLLAFTRQAIYVGKGADAVDPKRKSFNNPTNTVTKVPPGKMSAREIGKGNLQGPKGKLSVQGNVKRLVKENTDACQMPKTSQTTKKNMVTGEGLHNPWRVRL